MTPQYAAGLFDGEGSLSIKRLKCKNGKIYLSLLVQISNCSRPLLEALQAEWGGSIVSSYSKLKAGWRAQYCLKFCTKDAEKFLTDIHPFLILKKRQVTLGLKFPRFICGTGDNKAARIWKREQQFRIKEMVEKLNRWETI